MTDRIIALLENSTFIKNRQPNMSSIRSAKIEDIKQFCEHLADITSVESFPASPTLFSHSASLSLGGDRTPCERKDCRVQKVKELVQFASFYSDRVYINNFNYDFFHHESFDSSEIENIRIDFTNDIILLSYLAPLIEIGLIVPITFRNICPRCLAMNSLPEKARNNFQKLYDNLEYNLYEQIEYSLEMSKGHYAIIAKGSEYFIPHGLQVVILSDNSEIDDNMKSATRRLKERAKIVLTKKEAKTISAAKIFADDIIRNIAFELSGAKHLKTAYLSDRDIEIKLLNDLTDDPVTKRCSSLLAKHMNCLVPFIEGISPEQLIKLRTNEEESFILFRSAITNAIKEYRSHRETFTDRDAQILFADIIQPRLTKLEAKVKKAKRHFIKDSSRKLIGWVGALSFGIYTGLILSNLLAGSVTFGATKAAAELLGHIMAKSDAEEEIKDDEMYFLWKVKRLSN